MSDEDPTRLAVEALLAAIESRDLRKVECALHADAVWQNVPHAPAMGRESVMQMLASIICWSDKVQWQSCPLQLEATPVGMSVSIGFGSPGQSMRSRAMVSFALIRSPGESAHSETTWI